MARVNFIACASETWNLRGPVSLVWRVNRNSFVYCKLQRKWDRIYALVRCGKNTEELEGNKYEKSFGVSKLDYCQLSAENETLIRSKKNRF